MTLRCPGVYSRLVAAEAPLKDAEIVRDLNRTYPSHVYYQQRQGPGQLSLYNVLKAFSLYDAKVCASPMLSVCAGASEATRNVRDGQCEEQLQMQKDMCFVMIRGFRGPQTLYAMPCLHRWGMCRAWASWRGCCCCT
jgi:Rab-GTPase-TBC domain